MKTKLYLLFVLLSFICIGGHSQNKMNYDRDTKWNFGINTGGTWQQLEHTSFYNTTGFTMGMTLGGAIYEKEGRLLSLDLRGRLQFGNSKGWDSRPSYDPDVFSDHPSGMGYKNFRFGYGEGTLELVVNAHRLRERTGILLYAFGGIGFTDYTIKQNLYEANGQPYDYTSVDSTQSKENIALHLKRFFNDYSWETFHSVGTAFMPSLGLGFGYQLSPRFALAFEHKINFALNNDINTMPKGTNGDRYHYTAVTFRWNIFKPEWTTTPYNSEYTPQERPDNGMTSPTNTTNPDVYTTAPQGTSVPQEKYPPQVEFTQPHTNGSTVNNENYIVRAIVENVTTANQITLRQNGAFIPFQYNGNTRIVTAQVHLTEGNNTFEIKATNDDGSDKDIRSIIYKRPCNMPAVVVSEPIGTNTTTTNHLVYFRATIQNIRYKNQITLMHNNVMVPQNQYTFNGTTRVLTFNKQLSNGINVFKILANNDCGTSSKTLTVNYQPPQITGIPPVINFINPPASPYSVTGSNIFYIQATVLNVVSASQITFKLNGVNTSNFNFNTSTKLLTSTIQLNNGNNIVEIRAVNAAGSAVQSVIIKKSVQEQVLPPTVNILVPNSNPYITNNPTELVVATTTNIVNRNQIEVYLNGIDISNIITFNPATREIRLSPNLNLGMNSLTIEVANTAGSDSKRITIERKTVCVPPTVGYSIPASSPYNHVGRNGNMAFTFVVSNIQNKSQINVKNNGYTVPFNLDLNNNTVWGTVPLQAGSNTMIIEAQNSCGKAVKTLNVLYKGNGSKLVPPQITIQIPSNFPYTTTSSSITIIGKVTNVSHQNKITVSVNGQAVPFTYNTSTKKLTIPLGLNIGQHQIKVRAINNYGHDLEVFDIIRKEITVKPLIRYTNLGAINSSRLPFLSSRNTFTVKGYVKNHQGAKVSVYVNGNKTSSYTYDASTGRFSIPVQFPTQGNGLYRDIIVEVRAINKNESASKKGYLRYQVPSRSSTPKPKPNKPVQQTKPTKETKQTEPTKETKPVKPAQTKPIRTTPTRTTTKPKETKPVQQQKSINKWTTKP